MKKQIFLFILSAMPLLGTSQNFIFDIKNRPNGKFAVQEIDDSRETFPRSEINHGVLDTASLQLLAYQRIEEARIKEANLGQQYFFAKLKADQTRDSVAAHIQLNYNAYATTRWAGTFDGNYVYFSRDGNAINAYIFGYELRRVNNNNVLLTFVPQASNFLIATNGGASFNMYQSGNFWVGRKANGTVVTFKRQ